MRIKDFEWYFTKLNWYLFWCLSRKPHMNRSYYTDIQKYPVICKNILWNLLLVLNRPSTHLFVICNYLMSQYSLIATKKAISSRVIMVQYKSVLLPSYTSRNYSGSSSNLCVRWQRSCRDYNLVFFSTIVTLSSDIVSILCKLSVLSLSFSMVFSVFIGHDFLFLLGKVCQLFSDC